MINRNMQLAPLVGKTVGIETIKSDTQAKGVLEKVGNDFLVLKMGTTLRTYFYENVVFVEPKE